MGGRIIEIDFGDGPERGRQPEVGPESDTPSRRASRKGVARALNTLIDYIDPVTEPDGTCGRSVAGRKQAWEIAAASLSPGQHEFVEASARNIVYGDDFPGPAA